MSGTLGRLQPHHETFLQKDRIERPSQLTTDTNGSSNSTSPLLNSNASSIDSSTPLLNPPEVFIDEDGHDYPEGGVRAYSVVLGTFLGLMAVFGIMNTIGIFHAYLSEHQLNDYSPGTIGWIFGLYLFITFFASLQIGPIFDVHGPKWLMLAGSLLFTLGMMGFAQSTRYSEFVLTFSLFCGMGTSLVYNPASFSIAHFFFRSRAFATSLGSTAGSVGGTVFPLMLRHLFPLVGFTWAIRILGLVAAGLLLLSTLLVRSRLPAKRGQSIWPDLRIFANPTFALMTAGVFLIELALFVTQAYISSYAIHEGVNRRFSYELLSIMNASSFLSRLLSGWTADRAGRFNVVILTVSLCTISVFGLWLPAHNNRTLLYIFALLFGLASGSNISLPPICIGQLCSTTDYGRWNATCYAVVSLGCLTGIPLAGSILQANGGNYRGLIVLTGFSYAVGLVCFAAARIRSVGWSLKVQY